MDSRSWVAVALTLSACGGEKRAAPKDTPPAQPGAAAVASPTATLDSAIARRFAYAGPLTEGLARVRNDSARWGYVDSTGAFVIPARYNGAGDFARGEAPIQDSAGFALIDRTGRVVDRFRTDTAVAAVLPVPPPSDSCPSLESYLKELGSGAPARGGAVEINPVEGDMQASAAVSRLLYGVVVIEEHGYESFSRRALLPGVSADQARKWLLKIRRGRPLDEGDACEEHWESGAAPGGAFLLHHGGC